MALRLFDHDLDLACWARGSFEVARNFRDSPSNPFTSANPSRTGGRQLATVS